MKPRPGGEGSESLYAVAIAMIGIGAAKIYNMVSRNKNSNSSPNTVPPEAPKKDIEEPNSKISKGIDDVETKIDSLNIESIEQEIKNQIKSDDLEKALFLFEKIAKSKKYSCSNELIALRARLSQVKKEYILNTLSDETYRRELAKIRIGILMLLKETA